jgi:quaternary ammonium compound-resistance protein SugE
MAWLVLILAGGLEVGWAIGLKYTDGFTRPVPTLATVAAMAVSLGLLGYAVRDLPVGTAYAVWTGIGTVGTVLLGIFLFGESADLLRLAFIAMIVAGIVGLKIVTPATPAREWALRHPRQAPCGTGSGIASLASATKEKGMSTAARSSGLTTRPSVDG